MATLKKGVKGLFFVDVRDHLREAIETSSAPYRHQPITQASVNQITAGLRSVNKSTRRRMLITKLLVITSFYLLL